MSNDKKIERENQHHKSLESILFMFVSDEMDYEQTDDDIIEIVKQYTLKAITTVKEINEETK